MPSSDFDLVILRSVGFRDGRYLRENLTLLRPGQDVPFATVYRLRWVHPGLRSDEKPLEGLRAAVVFFDYAASLCVGVREAIVADASRGGGRLRLHLQLGGWLDTQGELPMEAIPRLPDESVEEGAPLPSDGNGPHAFVFPMPEEWRSRFPIRPAEDRDAWRTVVRALGRPDGSPYRGCPCLFVRPVWSGGGQVGGHLTLPVSPAIPELELSLEIPGATDSDAPVGFRIVATRGDVREKPIQACLRSGQDVRVPLEVALPDGGVQPLCLEIHLPECPDRSVPLSLELVAPPPSPFPVAVRPERPVRRDWQEPLWELLSSLSPKGEDQKLMARQMARRAVLMGASGPWLLDVVLGWGLYDEAATLLVQHSGWVRATSEAELLGWLWVFQRHQARVPPPLEEEVVARLRQGGSQDLVRGMYNYLENLPAQLFWFVLDLLNLPVESGSHAEDHLLDHPFGQELFLQNLWDPFLGLLYDRWNEAGQEKRAWIASLVKDGESWPHDWHQKELRAAVGGEPWVDRSSLLRRLPVEEALLLLASAPPQSILAAGVEAWYWENRRVLELSDPDLWAEAVYRVRVLAGPTSRKVWDAELAEVALASGDPLLLSHARRVLLEGEDPALLGRVEEALAEFPNAFVVEGVADRLRARLSGRRILLLGGQFAPGWLEGVREELGLSIVHKGMEKEGAYCAADIPSNVDFCAVLKWAGHDATRVAVERLGSQRVRFLHGTGRRAFFRALEEMAESFEGPGRKT